MEDIQEGNGQQIVSAMKWDKIHNTKPLNIQRCRGRYKINQGDVERARERERRSQDT